MAKMVAPLTKFAITVAASALGAGPLSTLPQELLIPLLKSVLGDKGADWLANLGDDVLKNLMGDYAKDFLDSLKREPPQDLQRVYVLALQQALINVRNNLRREQGERLLITGERMLPDDREKFFTDCLAKVESILRDRIDLEMLFRDQPALDAIYEADVPGSEPAGWGFLKRNLGDWAGQNQIPEDLELYLRRELPGILSDQFSTLLSAPNYQQSFNKHQAHFTHLLYQNLKDLEEKADRSNKSLEGVSRKSDQTNQSLGESHQKLDSIRQELQVLIRNFEAYVVNPSITAGGQNQTNLTEIRGERVGEWSHSRLITQDLFKQIVAFLIPEMGDAGARKSMIEEALFGSPVLQKIRWEGAARPFTVQLVRLLIDFGEISPGRPSLVALLEEVKPQVGTDRQALTEDLLIHLKPPPARQEIKPPPKTSGEPPLPGPLQTLYDAICTAEGDIVLPIEQAIVIKDHKPSNFTQYRLGRVAQWSLPRYQLDKRFVNLTLSMDMGEKEPQRWQKVEDFRSKDLREVLEKRKNDPVLVLLGKPGSGKSTLLRRLQLDHSIDRLRDGIDQISFFIQLNEYDGVLDPREWLINAWSDLYPDLPSLETCLQRRRVLLLLDALNEMPHNSIEDYNKLAGRWRSFAQQVSRTGNRLIFSCRGFDYGGRLSSKELPVPQVVVQPMDKDQVQEFLRSYIPEHAERIWGQIKEPLQFEFYQTPYFLDLLCKVVDETGDVPAGRAELFTYFVRLMLNREKTAGLFQPNTLLSEIDHVMMDSGYGPSSFDLPEDGELIPRLSDLAFKMQEKGRGPEASQVRISHAEACKLINHDRARDILKAGVSLNVIDIDTSKKDSVSYFHQLLQEYFAARRLAKEPNPALVHVEWAVEKVRPALKETLESLADGDPLPPLPQTGWEETTLTAAPMAKDPGVFIRDLIPHNLPLAARCAASPEVNISDELKREIQDALIARTQDMQVDLRARISAGEALGTIGDPRFELRQGPYGEFLMPPLVDIHGGIYPMGDDGSNYDDEKPAHEVDLSPFQIGKFPVTNAEYAKFMVAGGYEDEQWWDTDESLKWLREGGAEGNKQGWRDHRQNLQENWSEEELRDFVRQNRATSEQVEEWIEIRNWTDEEFEQRLGEQFPPGKLYRQPEFWDDTRFNNSAQPIVGISWFEARAYCNWLTANAAGTGGRTFRLPTEAEFEAAARGKAGRLFPYGETFDVTRSNTFESHIRRSTPVGVFENATPEGAFDLSGNVWTWTLSIYDQKRFPYPYQKNDGREEINATEVRRALRGGSWYDVRDDARAVYRVNYYPNIRLSNVGFRVVSVVCPPSQ